MLSTPDYSFEATSAPGASGLSRERIGHVNALADSFGEGHGVGLVSMCLPLNSSVFKGKKQDGALWPKPELLDEGSYRGVFRIGTPSQTQYSVNVPAHEFWSPDNLANLGIAETREGTTQISYWWKGDFPVALGDLVPVDSDTSQQDDGNRDTWQLVAFDLVQIPGSVPEEIARFLNIHLIADSTTEAEFSRQLKQLAAILKTPKSLSKILDAVQIQLNNGRLNSDFDLRRPKPTKATKNLHLELKAGERRPEITTWAGPSASSCWVPFDNLSQVDCNWSLVSTRYVDALMLNQL